MSLPELFLADRPPGAPTTPALIRDACIAIKRNRAQWLAPRRTQDLIEWIAYAAERWRDPSNPFRRCALEQGPAETGFGRTTLERGLDGLFASLTAEALGAWVAQDLGDVRRLDEFCGPMGELRQGRLALARGPELILNIAAGTLPNPAILSMVASLLVRSAQLMKCSARGSLIPRLFAHSLVDLEPKLGACLEIAVWLGGSAELEAAAFAEAECVTVHGSDETIASVRSRLPGSARLLAYGHRLSFGFVGAEMLSSFSARKVAEKVANDIAAWNQLGCLSPHVIYVEDTGAVSAEGFGELLASALEAREAADPRGVLPAESASAISGRRSLHEMREARSKVAHDEAVTAPRGVFFPVPDHGTRVWSSPESTAWTVVYEADPRFHASCLNRFITVKPCRDLKDALRYSDNVRGKVSTVGLALTESRAAEAALVLANWGVTRICPIGRMQEPPASWRHDGRPSLGDLVTWTDFET